MIALLAAAFAWPTPLPTTAPAPRPTVLWEGNAAASFALDVRPLDVTPDGEARALVRVVFRDARGAPARSRHGTDFTWLASRGAVQWQTGLRFGGPAAIVSVDQDGPVALRVVARRPALGERRAAFDTRRWRLARVAGGALGPHLARIGWFPRETRGPVRIERLDAAGRTIARASVPAPSMSWSDGDVVPGTVARYVVRRPGAAPVRLAIDVPRETPPSSAALLRGKAMWLAFSGDPRDDDGYAKIDVPRIVATARAAGLRAIELRLAYGAFDEVTPGARARIDALVDGLDAAGIGVLAWTVPRALAFDDLAATLRALRYRTAAGHGLRGLAVDLERGEEFLGEGPAAQAALAGYLRVVRRAAGPRALLVATVEDPVLNRLDGRRYPYAAIARDADVLQPMTYWRMLGPYTSPPAAARVADATLTALRALARRPIPVDLGAQSAPLGPRGAPTAAELRAVSALARRDAWGIAYYDWFGTGPEAWEAISAAP